MTKIPIDVNKYSENDGLGREELLRQMSMWLLGCKHDTEITYEDCKKCPSKKTCKQACRQIKALIQESKVTEEWIGEKARKMKELDGNWIREKAKIMHNMIYPPKVCEYKCDLMTRCKDFIRSLIEEIT